MRKNKIRRLAAAVLTAAMVASMGGMTALADPTEPGEGTEVTNPQEGDGEEGGNTTTETSDIVITKKIVKEANVYVPAVGTIQFVTEPSTQGGTDRNGKVVQAGRAGGLSVNKQPTFTVDENTLALQEVSGNIGLKIDKTVFIGDDGKLDPGIYRYTLEEQDHNYDGLSKDDTMYYVDLYVTENTTTGEPEFSLYIFNPDSPNAKVTNITNTYTTKDLVVKKVVSGNQGDKGELFDFAITVNGTKGEKYYLTKNGVVQTALTCDENGVATLNISLKHDDVVNIVGLSANDTFTVVENLANNQSEYTQTYKLGASVENAIATTGNKVENVSEENENKAVVVDNNRTVTPATGVIMSFGPYALLVVLAGVFGTLFLRKRKEDEI